MYNMILPVSGSIKKVKSFFTICLFILTGILSTKTSHAQATNFQDSLALVDIYNSTNGSNWTNNSGWLQGPVTNWFGVTLTGTRLGGLALGRNNLVGTIPFTIGNLTSLTNLNLSFNRLTGGIPTALSNLQNSLIQLNLSNNQFSGTIPSGFVNLINLNAFDLSANQLTGPIPAGFENLHGLISFKLDSNKFDFTGMEAIAQNFASLLVYSPQFPKLHLNFSVPNNLLSISAGGTVANNTYHWFNNGVSVANKTGDSTFNPSGCGKFWVTITNSLATQLTLSSDTFSIGVVPAITIAGTANNICAGTPVSFTATVSNGGTVPAYQWLLNGQPTGNNTSTYISGLLANNDVVSCILTSSDPCANPTKDTSNQIVMLVRPVVIASFAPIGPFCQNSIASVLPATSLEGITGTWNPSTINTATVGTTGYIFTPTAGQCAKTDTINITITAQVTPTFNAIGPLCQNSVAPALPASSKEGISGTWNPAAISTVTAGTTNYIFTPTTGGACAVPATLNVTITTQVTPTFNAIGPLCQNSVAPALPATSKEGISGTWNPAAISTVTAGTTNYIFTPTTGATCAVPATLSVTISPLVAPTFNGIGPLCQSSVAPALPATSKEGISGTWNPAVISTATAGTTNYIFTPTTGGACAVPATLSVTISARVTPTFNGIGPLCQNVTAPALPATSKEGISGTWNPAVINTSIVGTTNYIFTPTTGGACAVPATLSVTISPLVVPTFNGIGPLCQNSVAPALPPTSKEGNGGTWNPVAISTVNAGTTNYIFTPTTGGACAVPATLSVTISARVTPTFNGIGPLCQNATAPALPATSKEGISGTWNPAVINTATAGTTNYIFTPTTGGACAVPATLSITITAQVTPTFNGIGPLCQNATAPALPATSIEGISGTWNPAAINTATAGTTNYIFTPTTGGVCVVPATLSVTISARVTPTFNGIGPLCQNSVAPALPPTSREGISGTWNPTAISTATAGTTNYIFTPNTVGVCAVPATLSVTISPLVAPTFNGIGPLCQNTTAPALPAISKEGISGTWNPAVINTSTVGTTNYIFTPTTGGACVVSSTLSVTISTQVTPTFNGIGPLCQNSAAPALPVTSKEGISGTWNPAVINTLIVGATNYIFTPATGGACVVPSTLSVTISTRVAPTFNGIGPFCQNTTAPALPATSKEGINGTWNPAVINTATAGTTNYIFTPTTGGACAVPATLSVTITAQVAPTFNGIGPLCQNSAAPALPPTSKEGISGTWNPATINTATIGTTNYIFTPTIGSACAVPTTVGITITKQVTPTFNGIGPLCQNSTAPALPVTSKEVISGTWNPSTINTATIGTTNYIFTPTTSGACAVPSTLGVTITAQVAPTFNGIGPLCQNATAPVLPT